ncbi:hypothetical protein [Solibacillus sp. FSL H8-0538]|uniref:hypothetical protein n=1 Tax=Solibacillus sp. FSL H8-0538 TaxID=2921400 RepID=UPI0030FA6462
MAQENLLINQVLIESKYGNRSFNLILGDLLQDDGQLLVLNVYEEDGAPDGDFMPFIEQHKNNEKPLIFLRNGGIITFINAQQPILVVYSKLQEGIPISPTMYDEFIQSIFSAVLRLELEGKQFNTIALPVIFRKGIGAIYEDAANTLISYAAKWLKQSQFTKSIRYYVYLKDDMPVWDAALNTALGRMIIDLSEHGELQQIRRVVLSEIERFSKQHVAYQDTLIPIRDALERPQMTVEVIAAFTRKLAETLCVELTGDAHATFDANIFTLIQQKIHSQLFIQRLYLVKAFGNSSIHRATTENYPIQTTIDDLKILLIILLQLIKDFPKENLIKKVEVETPNIL